MRNSLLLAILASLAIVGCGKSATDSEPSKPESTPKTATANSDPASKPAQPEANADEYAAKAGETYKAFLQAPMDISGGSGDVQVGTGDDAKAVLLSSTEKMLNNVKAKGDAVKALNPPNEAKALHEAFVALVDPIVKRFEKGLEDVKGGDQQGCVNAMQDAMKMLEEKSPAIDEEIRKAGFDVEKFGSEGKLVKK